MTVVDAYGRPVDDGVGFLPPGPIVPPMPQYAEARSGHWPAFLKEFLRKNPECLGCGRHAQTGHHEVPYHVDPSLELTESNVVPVCVGCHWVLCHLSDWHVYDPECRKALLAHRGRVGKALKIP